MILELKIIYQIYTSHLKTLNLNLIIFPFAFDLSLSSPFSSLLILLSLSTLNQVHKRDFLYNTSVIQIIANPVFHERMEPCFAGNTLRTKTYALDDEIY